MTGTPKKSTARSASRLGAVQALYQMDIAGTDLSDILAEFPAHRLGREIEGERFVDADPAFFNDIVTGVVRLQRKLDPAIDSVLADNWTLARLDITLRAVLRAAAFEMTERGDVPPRVIINEYVDVAHAFFANDEPGFVNGALDRLARSVRGGELDHGKTA